MALSQWLWLATLSLLWGGSFLFVGIAVAELPTMTLVLARVGLAAAVLLPIVFLSEQRLPTALSGWVPFAVMACLNNLIPFSLITLGQREIASGLASVLNATTPIWSVLLAWALLAERPLFNRLAGVIIGVVGVAVLVGPDLFTGVNASVAGMAFCLGAAISYALSGLWGRRLNSHSPLVASTTQLICSTVMLAPIALLLDTPWTLPTPSATTVWAVIALAVFSTALSYLIFFHLLRISGSLNTMLVTVLIPVSAIALGTLFLGERLHQRHFLGATVIGLALLAIDGRVFTWIAARFKRGSA